MSSERYFIVDRMGIPYEGMQSGEPVFDKHGYNRPSTRTRIYKTLASARAQRNRIANICQESGMSVRRIAPSGAVTGILGEPV